MSTYALCGFSNFGAIGIQLGGLGAMVPSRRSDIAAVALRAMIAGNVACFMTACIAGMLHLSTPCKSVISMPHYSTPMNTIQYNTLKTYIARLYKKCPGALITVTRKPCYRKENRAMRPVYGCPENLGSPWLCPRLLFPKLLMGFCCNRSYESACKI